MCISTARGDEVVLMRDGHTWLFRTDRGGVGLLLERLAALAEDPRWPLDWVEASIVADRVTGEDGAGREASEG